MCNSPLPLSLRSKHFSHTELHECHCDCFRQLAIGKGAWCFPQLVNSHAKCSMGVTPCGAQGRPQTVFKWTPSNPCCVSSSLQIALVFNCRSHVCFKGNWIHMFVNYLNWAHHIVVSQVPFIVQKESPSASSYTAPRLSTSFKQEAFSALQNPLSRLSRPLSPPS